MCQRVFPKTRNANRNKLGKKKTEQIRTNRGDPLLPTPNRGLRTSLAIRHRGHTYGYSHRRPNHSKSPNRRHFTSLYTLAIASKTGMFVRGLLGTGPPRTPSTPSCPPLLRGRFGIEIGSNRKLMSNQCDVELMPNRPLRRGWRGGFEGEVRGLCA